MSIFSSCDAAPNSGVMTYSEVSTSGTMADSPWPMPEVSTTIRSKPLILHARQHFRQRGGDFRAGIARRQRAHEDLVGLDRIHANAIAEQRAAGALARRVDRDDGHAQPIVLIEAQAQNQFIGQRGLARAAGAGDAEDGGFDAGGRLQQPPGARASDRSDFPPR